MDGLRLAKLLKEFPCPAGHPRTMKIRLQEGRPRRGCLLWAETIKAAMPEKSKKAKTPLLRKRGLFSNESMW